MTLLMSKTCPVRMSFTKTVHSETLCSIQSRPTQQICCPIVARTLFSWREQKLSIRSQAIRCCLWKLKLVWEPWVSLRQFTRALSKLSTAHLTTVSLQKPASIHQTSSQWLRGLRNKSKLYSALIRLKAQRVCKLCFKQLHKTTQTET